MEFRRLTPAPSIKVTTISYLDEKYPSNLSLYSDIPTEQVDIEELQEMAVERVKLLRVLEWASFRATGTKALRDVVIDELRKQNLRYFMPLIIGQGNPELRRRDYLSHFILRLCYSHSEDLRRWFLAREMEFFRLKFYNLGSKEEVLLFMKMNDLNYSPISNKEKKSKARKLRNSTFRKINLGTTNVYKVYFTEVLDLVKKRRVFIKAGMAYVLEMDLISILSTVFRKQLSYALTICASNIPKLETDERLSRILKGLHTSYMGNDYCAKIKGHVPKEAIDGLSTKSFPLCMRAMYETFKKTHHLRYMARLQFGLFLKGIGVSLQDSLRFWKEGFTKKPDISGEVFDKRYAYSIRHSYGTEGKRANYSPHSCIKIITSSVGPGENHGCPFKHYSAKALKQKLLSYNLSLVDVSNIVDYATKGHFQLACTKYFEVTHNVTNPKGITHPNLYFQESQNILNEKVNENVKKTGKDAKADVPKQVDEWDISFDLNITKIVENAENSNLKKN